MSVRDDSPLAPAPRAFTFADAFTAKGEHRRRILEAIVKQNEVRGEQLQAMTRATMQATPTPITRPSSTKMNRVR